MRTRRTKLILFVILLSLVINPATSQENSLENLTYRFSEHLKKGIELTWQFKKFYFDLNETIMGFDQMNSEVAGSEGNSTEIEVIVEFPINFNVPIGTLYTIKLLKDLSDLTQDNFYFDYELDYQNNYDDYFNISASMDNAETIISFFDFREFISPAVLEFENNTRQNALENEYQDYLEWKKINETYPEVFANWSIPEISIANDIYNYNYDFTDSNTTLAFRKQLDINTGVSVYVYGYWGTPEFIFEVEIELYEAKGININYLESHETSLLPVSGIFVYPMILIPIIIRKIKSKLN